MAGQSTRATDGGRIPGIAEIQNVVEIRLIWTLANGKQASSRLFGQHQGSFVASSAMANQLFNAISPHWVSRLGPFLNGLVTFTALTIRDMTVATNAEWRSSQPAVSSGGTGNAMPQDVALVLTAETVQRGRGAKGRLYIPGWSVGANNANGQASQNAQDGLTGFGTDLRTELNAVALTSCVAKPARQEYVGLTGATHQARAAGSTQVTAYICQNGEWDTQRRRGF